MAPSGVSKRRTIGLAHLRWRRLRVAPPAREVVGSPLVEAPYRRQPYCGRDAAGGLVSIALAQRSAFRHGMEACRLTASPRVKPGKRCQESADPPSRAMGGSCCAASKPRQPRSTASTVSQVRAQQRRQASHSSAPPSLGRVSARCGQGPINRFAKLHSHRRPACMQAVTGARLAERQRGQCAASVASRVGVRCVTPRPTLYPQCTHTLGAGAQASASGASPSPASSPSSRRAAPCAACLRLAPQGAACWWRASVRGRVGVAGVQGPEAPCRVGIGKREGGGVTRPPSRQLFNRQACYAGGQLVGWAPTCAGSQARPPRPGLVVRRSDAEPLSRPTTFHAGLATSERQSCAARSPGRRLHFHVERMRAP